MSTAGPRESEEATDTRLYPAVAQYGPYTVTDLKVGETRQWCACGLTKNEPWCDGSHKGTGIKKIKWTVSKNQKIHQICGCKYTKTPPYCDGTHTNLPAEVLKRQSHCPKKPDHGRDACSKLCTGCGWVPDF